MYRLMSVITKSPDVSTEDFRRFMRDEYGPVYQALPEVRAYRQSFLSATAGSDGDGPDAVVEIAFDSPEAMRSALDNDAYRAAVVRRGSFMARVEARVLDAVNVLA